MLTRNWAGLVVVTALCGVSFALAATAGRAADDTAAAVKPPPAFTPPTAIPAGAIMLLSGKQSDVTDHFYTRYTKKPGGWTVDAEGVATPDKHDIVTRQDFGDCIVHVEFRCPANDDGTPRTTGNSGVGFMGRYEVQILNSYGHKPEKHECGALYSEVAPLVIASSKPGVWQTYDIQFRAPRFDADGKVTEPARATVYQNGILIQNNQDFTGPTGIQYGENKGEVKSAPLILQGDHDPVQFRTVWILPE